MVRISHNNQNTYVTEDHIAMGTSNSCNICSCNLPDMYASACKPIYKIPSGELKAAQARLKTPTCL